jgi:hypothetical protein
MKETEEETGQDGREAILEFVHANTRKCDRA